jgi:hypothetical protein
MNRMIGLAPDGSGDSAERGRRSLGRTWRNAMDRNERQFKFHQFLSERIGLSTVTALGILSEPIDSTDTALAASRPGKA